MGEGDLSFVKYCVWLGDIFGMGFCDRFSKAFTDDEVCIDEIVVQGSEGGVVMEHYRLLDGRCVRDGWNTLDQEGGIKFTHDGICEHICFNGYDAGSISGGMAKLFIAGAFGLSAIDDPTKLFNYIATEMDRSLLARSLLSEIPGHMKRILLGGLIIKAKMDTDSLYLMANLLPQIFSESAMRVFFVNTGGGGLLEEINIRCDALRCPALYLDDNMVDVGRIY